MRKPWWLAAAGFALIASGGAWYVISGDDSGDPLARSGEGQGLRPVTSVAPDLTGEPLFPFGNLYLDGRSAWLRRQFATDRETLLGLTDSPPEFECTPVVFRDPFTEGAWVAELVAEDIELREAVEGQTVDTAAAFVIEGIEPLELLLFIACSDYRGLLDDGKVDVEWIFPGETPPDECLSPAPDLAPQQMLTHERWKRPLASPTDVWFVNDLRPDGDCQYMVYEAWRNCGDDSHASVRLNSGQYAVVPCAQGTAIRIHNYYSGQAIPPLMGGIVVSMTKSYYRRVEKTLQEHAPTWEPSDRARQWFAGFMK